MGVGRELRERIRLARSDELRRRLGLGATTQAPREGPPPAGSRYEPPPERARPRKCRYCGEVGCEAHDDLNEEF
jgi:hypothetical protein